MALDEIRQTKIEKIEKLKKAGVDPYPASSGRTHEIVQALLLFDSLSANKTELVLVGRIMAKREHGGSIFFDVKDGTGQIQAYLKQDVVGEDDFKTFNELFDIGDFVEIYGTLFKTKKEEKTLEVQKYKLLTKALLPLPEKWHGIQDSEEKLRKRYLDILFNPEVKQIIEKRAMFWNAVREFHVQNGFLEVETPVLETTVGGADATPPIPTGRSASRDRRHRARSATTRRACARAWDRRASGRSRRAHPRRHGPRVVREARRAGRDECE